MNPDDICAAYDAKSKITIQIDEDEDMVVVEGEAQALEFIGNLFLAQAGFKDDCSFFIGPHSAGYAHFTRQSTHGLYIHRLPCMQEFYRALKSGGEE